MRLAWPIVSAIALAAPSTARPLAAMHLDPDTIWTGFGYTIAFLTGAFTGFTVERKMGPVSPPLLDTTESLESQIAALSPQDRELLRQLGPRLGDLVTELDLEFFKSCLTRRGVTARTAIKYALPIAVYCKQQLDRKKERELVKQWQAAGARRERNARRAARQMATMARRFEQQQRRSRNQFARVTLALGRVGRWLGSGLRAVFDPNPHSATAATAAAAAAAAHGALPWQGSSPRLEAVFQQQAGRLFAVP
ncbi:MAG: hypothetical protein M1826_004430 [Phylliscum demangeonii]|nr:MAG: hypothetical protein M1826_004430 [Phylliscum demangeonii]